MYLKKQNVSEEINCYFEIMKKSALYIYLLIGAFGYTQEERYKVVNLSMNNDTLVCFG